MVTYNASPSFFHPDFSKKITAIEAPDLSISQVTNTGTQPLNLCASTEGDGLEKVGEIKVVFGLDELAGVLTGSTTYQQLLSEKISGLVGEQITLADIAENSATN